jgi:hypothetical protein
MKKVFAWISYAVALGCFAVALVTIAARFGGDVALIVAVSAVGFAFMGMGNKMIA